jgi:hypothetical protein
MHLYLNQKFFTLDWGLLLLLIGQVRKEREDPRLIA